MLLLRSMKMPFMSWSDFSRMCSLLLALRTSLRAMDSHHREPTTDAEGLSGNKGSIWGSQEGDSNSNLFWAGQPSQRSGFDHRFDDAFTTGTCLKGFQKGRLGWT